MLIDLISRLFLSVCVVQTADDINANELLSQVNEKEKEFRRLFVSPFVVSFVLGYWNYVERSGV